MNKVPGKPLGIIRNRYFIFNQKRQSIIDSKLPETKTHLNDSAGLMTEKGKSKYTYNIHIYISYEMCYK